MMLEALVHPSASFLTMTYNNDNLPEGGTLVPRHMQLFLKRLRRDGPLLRFFGVGEYGDQSFRPHYHMALFGYGREHKDEIQRCWDHGFTYTGDLTLHSAAYIAGYVTKKMTDAKDPRLKGRHPEFARMSLRPGIGAVAINDVAAALQNRHGWDEIGRTGDVPQVLQHGQTTYPLGRYLRRKLREGMHFASTGGQEINETEVFSLYQNYLLSSEKTSFKRYLQEVNKVHMDRMENRFRILNSKRIAGAI